MNRGEIWHADLGKPYGCEQGFNRPCLIVQCDKANECASTVTILPITTKNKDYSATHVQIDCLNSISFVECEQVRTVDKKRLKRFKCNLDEDSMCKVEQKLKLHLGL